MTAAQLICRPTVFRQVTTLTIEEFERLCQDILPAWEQAEIHRKTARPNRTRAVGQGHPYALDQETMLLMVIIYLKTPIQAPFLGLLFGIWESTVYELLAKWLPVLGDRFVPVTKLRQRRTIKNLNDLIAAYPGIETVLADGTEFPIRRPKRQQCKNYSGKSHRHAKKAVLIANPQDGLILARTKLRPGSVHDKRLLAEDRLGRALNKDPDLQKIADRAWTGEDPARGWVVMHRTRRNHPLTDQEKRANRRLAKVRIKVEHAIRRLKVFRRVAGVTAFRSTIRFEQALDAAISLANFKQLVRHPVTA